MGAGAEFLGDKTSHKVLLKECIVRGLNMNPASTTSTFFDMDKLR